MFRRDPNGPLQDRIRVWFQGHPDVAALWEQWIAEYAEGRRTKGEKLGDLVRQFPYMPSLWPQLDERFSKEGTTEQSDGEATSEPAQSAEPEASHP